MSVPTEKDYRKRPCPNCGIIGQIYLDYASAKFACRACEAIDIDPYKEQQQKAAPIPVKKKVAPIFSSGDFVADERPPIAAGTHFSDIVTDYYDDAHKLVTSRVYCPRIAEKLNEEFDPDTPQAKFIMKLYGAKFKNRRRYNRDIIKRAKENDLQAKS